MGSEPGTPIVINVIYNYVLELVQARRRLPETIYLLAMAHYYIKLGQFDKLPASMDGLAFVPLIRQPPS